MGVDQKDPDTIFRSFEDPSTGTSINVGNAEMSTEDGGTYSSWVINMAYVAEDGSTTQISINPLADLALVLEDRAIGEAQRRSDGQHATAVENEMYVVSIPEPGA